MSASLGSVGAAESPERVEESAERREADDEDSEEQPDHMTSPGLHPFAAAHAAACAKSCSESMSTTRSAGASHPTIRSPSIDCIPTTTSARTASMKPQARNAGWSH